MSQSNGNQISMISKDVLYQGWSRIVDYRFTYQRGDGTVSERSWEVCERPEASAVLVYNRDLGKLIFVRQFRPPVYAMKHGDGFFLEIAAGLIDEGETPDVAARREVREETGYAVGKLEPITAMISAPGLMTEKVHCFAAIVDGTMHVDDGGGLAEENEDIELVELSLDEASAMIQSGEISDAKTVIAVQWALLNPAFFEA